MRGSTSGSKFINLIQSMIQMTCHNNIALVGRERDAGNDDIDDEDDDNGWICTAPAHQEFRNRSARS